VIRIAWDGTRTARVRLDLPDDRKSGLHATNIHFQPCANRTADWAWRYPDEDCVAGKSEAEDAIYEGLREEIDYLHANLVQKGNSSEGSSPLLEGRSISTP
jgi:hypothetical protein